MGSFGLELAVVGALVLVVAVVLVVVRRRRQESIDASVVATARSALVEQLVDLDVALSVLVSAEPEVRPVGWRTQLLGELARRTSGGVSEWAPVLMASRQGQRDLVAFAAVRVALLRLRGPLEAGDGDTRAAIELRHLTRKLAWVLEADGAPGGTTARVEPDWSRSVRSWAWASDEADEPVRRLLLQVEAYVDRRRRSLRSDLGAPTVPASVLLPGLVAPAAGVLSPAEPAGATVAV